MYKPLLFLYICTKPKGKHITRVYLNSFNPKFPIPIHDWWPVALNSYNQPEADDQSSMINSNDRQGEEEQSNIVKKPNP